MITGDAAKGLQVQFFLNWFFTKKELILFEEQYFPEMEKFEGVPTAIVGSQPDSDYASIMEGYYQMIHVAREEVLIATPYFVPNTSILTALRVTAKSGVSVKILLPGKSDTLFVHLASLSYVEELLENDIEVYFYEKGMMHSKVMIVDGEVCSVGTANMDYRSFDNNSEVNAFFFSKEVSEKLRQDFYADLKDARKVEPEEWKKRSLKIKLIGSIGRLIAPLL